MPFKSEAQRRLMYAIVNGLKSDVPKSVAEKFTKHDQGGKLPEKVDGTKRTSNRSQGAPAKRS